MFLLQTTHLCLQKQQPTKQLDFPVFLQVVVLSSSYSNKQDSLSFDLLLANLSCYKDMNGGMMEMVMMLFFLVFGLFRSLGRLVGRLVVWLDICMVGWFDLVASVFPFLFFYYFGMMCLFMQLFHLML